MRKGNLYIIFTILLTVFLFSACSKDSSNSSNPLPDSTDESSNNDTTDIDLDATDLEHTNTEATDPEDTDTETSDSETSNPDSTDIDSDTTAPVAVYSPENGLTIGPDQQIIISFNETINTDSLVLDGTFVPESDAGVWSNSTVSNDTLTISPTFGWTTGIDKTLIIDCKDTSGNNLSTLSLTYNVDADIPSFGVLPGNSSTINNNQDIVITFSESMNTATLNFGGSMTVESNGGVWSSSTYENDTLTVSPALASTWTGGGHTLEINCDDVYGNSIPAINLNYTVDITPPTHLETPVSGSTIDVNQIIEIIFDESIDSSSLSLGGDLSGESDGGFWSITTFTDDTLTISPHSSWTGGAARTLTIDCDDLFGNSITTITLSYTIDTVLPDYTETPLNVSSIGNDQIIVLSFTESIDTSSLVLGGALAGESDGGSWSTTNYTNDTLTIGPSGTWSDGTKDMTIDCADLYGNAVTQISLTYTINSSTVTYNISPASGSSFGASQAIEIIFNASMDSSSHIISGSMSADSDGGVWCTTTYADDTLIISPSASWTHGIGRTLTIDCDDAASTSIPSIELTYNVDATAPMVEVSPIDGSTICGSLEIVLTFNESIDTATFVLAGTMATESDGGLWSTTLYTNDTLTIKPIGKWINGAGRTLTIDCDDMFGNSLSTVYLTYDVDATGPSATTFPPKKDLTLTDPVIFTFDESIDTSSVVLNGQMADDCDGGVWSTTTFLNDTLTLSPITEWDTTAPLRMNIDCTDIHGNTAVPQIKGMWQIK